MLAIAHIKHIIQFFQCQILGLGEQEVAEDPAEDVPGGVPAESTGAGEGGFEGGPGEGEDEVEALRRNVSESDDYGGEAYVPK